ncbi:uncharacterized protein LODBEIA_P60550 [Lodderomyces beijingensis]|uniref:J domain-containing protein n=1 Tax=Lodderomyces beijingensis TaxID=1775926 RepID=A0ABP0ZUL9_9ASCO
MMFSRGLATSAQQTHYQLLELPLNASIKEIKLQFKKLSKKYHPDLNTHLSDAARQDNTQRYTLMVSAYDTLKDVKRKRAYDQSLRSNTSSNSSYSRRSPASNKYYGEAKYYSRHGHSYHASTLNTKRHRVHFHNNRTSSDSQFSGEHVNHGDRYNVPHFDYDRHLHRNLMFEQRIIEKSIDQATRDKILNQLYKSGEKISEELKTKHLMRHVNMLRGDVSRGGNLGGRTSSYSNVKYGESSTYSGAGTYANMYAQSRGSNGGGGYGSGASTGTYNMYQKPKDDGGMFKVVAAIGASTSLYLLYKIIF